MARGRGPGPSPGTPRTIRRRAENEAQDVRLPCFTPQPHGFWALGMGEW